MSWPDTLDAYAEHLDLLQQVLEDGLQVVVAPFLPPTDLGPLPAALAERAQLLFEQGADLEAMMLEAREALIAAIAETKVVQRPAPRPSMLDARV